MARVRIWDAPTRLFHWMLVFLIAFSWWSAKQEYLDWHIWSGLAVCALLIFRILWGLAGSSTARFANFVRGRRQVMSYLCDMKGWRSIGHSPLGALSVLAMLGAIAVQVGLGLFAVDKDGLYEGPLARLVSLDLSEELTDLHEDWFNFLLILIGLHLAALLFYRLYLGKKLIVPMITGNGEADENAVPLQSGRWWALALCVAIAIGGTRWLMAGLPPFGG